MRRQNPNWLWLLILIGFLVGLWLIFYPQINTAVYEYQTEKVLDTMNEQISQAEEHLSENSVDESLIYEELAKAMILYNEQLAEEKQIHLTSPEAYEQPALDLSDYGLADNSPIGFLSIPAIGLELPIYLGATKENMAKGAVVLGQTSLPVGGESTNCVIAGHRGYRGIPYFRYLDDLEEGDLVYLTNFWGTMTYTVMETAVIQPDNIDAILIQNGRDMLTLLTCHPYTVGTQRLLIYCERGA